MMLLSPLFLINIVVWVCYLRRFTKPGPFAVGLVLLIVMINWPIYEIACLFYLGMLYLMVRVVGKRRGQSWVRY